MRLSVIHKRKNEWILQNTCKVTDRTWTHNIRDHNPMLYQLSYSHSSGNRTWTCDLLVMSQASFQLLYPAMSVLEKPFLELTSHGFSTGFNRICAIRTPPQHPKCRMLPLHHILYIAQYAFQDTYVFCLTTWRIFLFWRKISDSNRC